MSYAGVDQNHFIIYALSNTIEDNLALKMTYSGRKRKMTDKDKIALKDIGLYKLICGKFLLIYY